MTTAQGMASGVAAPFRNALPVLRSAGLVGSAEIVNRITHIVTAIALARCLGVVEFGIAAAAITVHELTRMFIQNGLGTRIITATNEELQDVAASVHRLNWRLGIMLASVQLCFALSLAVFWEASQLALAIAALALVHVIYPIAMVSVFLAQRDARWRCFSGAIAAQAVFDNLLTAGLAVGGAGIWAVVIPKILVAPLWVIWHRVATPWSATVKPDAVLDRQLLSHATKILGVEILANLRAQGDKALIGLLMGPQALGLYAFAANIGNSITTGLSQCISSVLLPFLRRGRENGNLLLDFSQSLVTLLLPIVPVVAAQGLLAWWYVPLVFGDKWNDAIPLLLIISIFSLVRPVTAAVSQLLRASDNASTDMLAAAITTALFFTGLVAGSTLGLVAATAGGCIGMAVGAVVSLCLAIRRTIARTSKEA